MGFVPNMRVPCTFYVNQHLQQLMFEELEQFVSRGDVGGFLPAVKQLANVAALPGAFSFAAYARWLPACTAGLSAGCRRWSGIVKASIALPDVHSGYGFAIGNVAAFDVNDPESIVSPGAILLQACRGLWLAEFSPLDRRRRRLRHQLRRAAAAHEPGGVGRDGRAPSAARCRPCVAGA